MSDEPAIDLPIYAPLQPIEDEYTRAAGIQLWLKREDRIHPQMSGNKWRKLKYNLRQARQQGAHTLLTFGGAYSNHIRATAAAGQAFGFRTVGLVRGEETLPLNPVLTFAKNCGMTLEYVDRETYRQKNEQWFRGALFAKYGEGVYVLPEGGSNGLAVKGCAEIFEGQYDRFDYLMTACGTGGTLAGLLVGQNDRGQVIGFPALKGAAFLYDDVKRLLGEYGATTGADQPSDYHNWFLSLDYHFGGYAKTLPALQDFMGWFEARHGVRLDRIYTGKMLYGVYDLMRQGFFRRGVKAVALHTGGVFDD